MDPKRSMTKTKGDAAEMYPLVEAYIEGELTQRDFSAEHGMSLPVLCYWLAKYRRNTAEPGAFLEIQPVAAEADRPLLEVCYPTGVRLRIFSPLKAACLDHLLARV